MSRKSARRLGFAKRGTARVRVRVLTEESLALKFGAAGDAAGERRRETVSAAPRQAVDEVETMTPKIFRGLGKAPVGSGVASVAAALEAAPVTIVPVRPSSIFVQAGAFADAGNAIRLRSRLARIGPTRIDKVVVADREYYRVRVGPVDNVEEGDSLLSAVVGAGFSDARLIVD